MHHFVYVLALAFECHVGLTKNSHTNSSRVAHTCIPSTWESQDYKVKINLGYSKTQS